MKPEVVRRLRLTPLNQIAALKLKAVGICCPPESIPVFQLMEWGLVNGRTATDYGMFKELLKLRFLPDQEQALAYLTDHAPEGLPALQKKLLRLSPRRAAEALLDLLDMRLRADPHNPYPEGRPRS